jgi:phospholipase/lecithinase/hemolysin
MRKLKRYGLAASLATLLALGLAGCGGNDSLPPKASISKVYVMGDSLADVGTFGFKFTVEDPANANNSLIWTQVIANNLGLDGGAQCNFFAFNGTTFAPNTATGCTNFAIGGGRIQVSAALGGDASPQTVGSQLATRAAAGNYQTTDLLMIDGGGNDAADLVKSFLGVPNSLPIRDFLLQQIAANVLDPLLAQGATGTAQAAGLYMTMLADKLYTAIDTQALSKGATKIAVLNIPDITLTPDFKLVLDGVKAANGEAASLQLKATIQQWIGAFNAQLKSKVNGNPKIAHVDFNTDFTDEISNYRSYSLTDVTTPVCTVVKSAAAGNFPCLSTELDNLPGKTAGWWKSYAFADGFHPTPYGHQLLAASVSRALARAGWL